MARCQNCSRAAITPTLEDLTFEGVGHAYTGGTSFLGSSLVINGGSTATVRRNTLRDGGPIGIFDLSVPLVEGNTLTDGPHIFGFPGTVPSYWSNSISGTNVRGTSGSTAPAPSLTDEQHDHGPW